MDIPLRIQAVHQRASLLRQRALELPVRQDLLAEALQELDYVLEELQTAKDDLQQQNQALLHTRQNAEDERQRYQDLFDLAPDGYLVTDSGGLIKEANVEIAGMFNVPQKFLVGKPVVLFIPEELHSTFRKTLWDLKPVTFFEQTRTQNWESQVCPRHGSPIDVHITLSITGHSKDGTATYRWLFRDITQQKLAEAKIHHQAFYDPLTQLPNRAFFNIHLPQALALAERQNKLVAVLFLDLDQFKTINDTLGHAVGDQLLQEVAQRLSSCLRKEDLLGRWGGDEFTLVLHQVESVEAVALTCERILINLHPPFQFNGHTLHISTSIGVALFPQDGGDRETLLRHADQALYQAKEEGRDTYRFYSTNLNSDTTEGLMLENDLHQALANQEFRLYFQPQIDYSSGEVICLEALLRWQHPRLGLLLPKSFLGIAEKTGLILAIGEWVLREGIRQAQMWQAAGFSNLLLAINFSAKQLQQVNFVKQTQQILQDSQYSPTQLELEITETTAIRQLQLSQTVLENLVKTGVRVCLDDFGTGYSALHLLKHLPLHKLKIDNSFVSELADNPKDQAIVTAIMALSQGLNLDIVAEGVETQEQATALQALGCNYIQGYMLASPLASAQVIDFLIQRLKM